MRVFVASTDRKWWMELIHLSSMYAALYVFMIFWCKEKELSKIIPRLLSDLLNSVGMSLIFKDVGKAWDSCLLCGYQYCFNFVMIHLKFVAHIQDLTSHMHFSMFWMVALISDGLLEELKLGYLGIINIHTAGVILDDYWLHMGEVESIG